MPLHVICPSYKQIKELLFFFLFFYFFLSPQQTAYVGNEIFNRFKANNL